MNCNSCNRSQLDVFLDLGTSPIADAYTSTPTLDSPRFPLQVAVCRGCQLVQLVDAPDGRTLFQSGYSFYSSSSPQLSAYHADYAAQVMERYPHQVGRGVLEVGCNDGDLLRHFPRGFGVDPSDGPTQAARDRGCDVLTEPFTAVLADKVRAERGRYGVIIANHVLAHVDDVADTLAGVAHLLDDDGVAIIEVQYLPDLLVNNAFDFVYHEHRNYFSLTTLASAAIRHGLHAVDVELTDRQHGSVRAVFAKSAGASPRVGRVLRAEAWLPSGYAGLQGRAERIRTRIRDLVASAKGVTAVYGAPAKATTLLNFCGFTSKDLAFCTDLTPAKWGRHIPGTAIPIQEPGVLPDTYLLGVWNYAGSVMRNNPGPRWIMPLPAPMLL